MQLSEFIMRARAAYLENGKEFNGDDLAVARDMARSLEVENQRLRDALTAADEYVKDITLASALRYYVQDRLPPAHNVMEIIWKALGFDVRTETAKLGRRCGHPDTEAAILCRKYPQLAQRK